MLFYFGSSIKIITFILSGLKPDTMLEVEIIHLGQMSRGDENIAIMARGPIKDENIIISTGRSS
jgi:hypothetical protein